MTPAGPAARAANRIAGLALAGFSAKWLVSRDSETLLTESIVGVVRAIQPVASARTVSARLFAAAATGRDTNALGLQAFDLPFTLPLLAPGMAWHPRNDRDHSHSWLRERIRHVFTAQA